MVSPSSKKSSGSFEYIVVISFFNIFFLTFILTEKLRYNKGNGKRRIGYMEKLYDLLQQKFAEEENVKVGWVYVRENEFNIQDFLDIRVQVTKKIKISFYAEKREKGYFLSLIGKKELRELKENNPDIRLYKENILSYYKIIKESMEEMLKNDRKLRIQHALGESLIKEDFILRIFQQEGESKDGFSLYGYKREIETCEK